MASLTPLPWSPHFLDGRPRGASPIPSESPLAKIGSASRTMPKEATVLLRGAFDLGVRREPQAFAADAMSLWILNQSLLIINELALYDAKPIIANFSGP